MTTATKTVSTAEIEHLKQDAHELFSKYPAAAYVRFYPRGFVPSSYRWPSPAERIVCYPNGTSRTEYYDRKRPHGTGPSYVVYSKRDGRLASY